MKKVLLCISIIVGMVSVSCNKVSVSDNTGYVNKFIGTGGDSRVTPIVSVPFGMMQLGADTRPMGSGYHYDDPTILGFSHLHKSGGGCADFLDILFMPLPGDTSVDALQEIHPRQFQSPFSHDKESAEPGYYSVDLYDGEVAVELTASRRCGIQRYTYKEGKQMPLLIDLEYGSQCACTIEPEHDVDTVYSAYIELVDSCTIRGYRKSNGWAYHQQVYFYTTFSAPVRSAVFYVDNLRTDKAKSVSGENVKLLLDFGDAKDALSVQTAISSVDMEGAFQNWQQEVAGVSFEEVRQAAGKEWKNVLAQIEIETPDAKKKELFYTSLHNVLLYPMLFSDVDYRFRGPDSEVHQTDGFDYYGAVIGLWDTFRAACPLAAVLQPEVMSAYIKTALEHYKYAGQLPIWTLAGMETYQMIGLHSMPLITNCYMNGITDFDQKMALEAMVHSAMKDTCGYSMGYFVGLENYKKYGYVPCDLEMESVARTLEYAFDDKVIATFAGQTGNKEVADLFNQRAQNYRNVIDPETLLARGRDSKGGWRTPFYPLRSEHRKDDYCEGNAWQWTFFVPHDIEGLAGLMGGKQVLEARLDSLFTMTSALQGEDVSGDISGLVGQYAHGNEPGHHTIYMYNKLGAAHKTQRYVHHVMNTLYDTTPKGICGNEDTGQMSAWYVFSALGFYPMDPVSGQYELGTPSFEKATIHLPSGKDFTVRAEGLTGQNYLVEEVWLDGVKLDRSYITFQELLKGGELVFKMKNKIPADLLNGR